MPETDTTATSMGFLAVHGLAVKKSGDATAVASMLGADPAEVERALDAAVADGWVIGARGTFMVTPAGRSWLEERYPQLFAGYRANPELAQAYERFERVNRDLLTLMTDWQSVPTGGGRVHNDHLDADYDRRIFDRLGDLHERAEKVFDRLVAVVARLARYRDRLDAAYDRVLAGEIDYVSGVRIDSYHTVWFELHEDLLRMLGRTREE